MESHLSWFPDPKLIVISNSQWIGDEVPCLTYGMRGMLCATVRVDGGGRNLHSGNDGGVFNEPMSDLVRLMATLLDSYHHILVPGFYEDVDKQLLAPALAGIEVGPVISRNCSDVCTIVPMSTSTLDTANTTIKQSACSSSCECECDGA